MTIRDIARIANVSRSTVSLALNDSPRINAETKRRVLEIVEQLDYHPNAMARALVGGQTKVLSLVVPQIDHVFSDRYFSDTVSGVTDATAKLGYSLMLQVATPQFIEDLTYDRLFKERRIDGMLIVGTLTTDTWLERLRDKNRHICLVNSQWEGISSVSADNRAGVARAVDHLVKLGHREIGYIKGLDITTVGLQRDEGFRTALSRHGIPYDESQVGYGNFSEQSGAQAMRDLLGRRRVPKAIFAMNDMMAIGAMRILRERGMRVPEDVAIIGGDDIFLAGYVTPGLTTIRQPMDEIGYQAVEILLDLLKSSQDKKRKTPPVPIERVIDTELIVRDSCGARLAKATVR